MKSGIVAAETLYEKLTSSPDKTVATSGSIDPEEKGVEVGEYQKVLEKSWVSMGVVVVVVVVVVIIIVMIIIMIIIIIIISLITVVVVIIVVVVVVVVSKT